MQLSRLPDLGLDSLTAARLAALFNRASTHSTLSPTSLYLPSLPSVLTSNSEAAVAPFFDLEKECTLPADLNIQLPLPPPPSSPAQLLLTGGTGFLGLHLLSALLHRFASAHITLLVRASSHAAASERLKHMATALSVWSDIELHTHRVTVLAGDLTMVRRSLT